MPEQSPYMSNAWLTMMEAQAQEILASVPAAKSAGRFTLAEWIVDEAPEGGPGAAAHRGFHMEIVDGRVRVRPITAAEAADVRIEFPREVAYRLTKIKAGPELDSLIAEAAGSGALRIIGDPSGSPFPDRVLHDAVAERTL